MSFLTFNPSKPKPSIWGKYPFLKLLTALVSGILTYPLFPVLWINAWIILSVLLATSIIINFLAFKLDASKLSYIGSFFIVITLLYLGGFLVKFHYQGHPPSHYQFIHKKVKGFSGTIVSKPTEGKRYVRYQIELNQIVLEKSVQVSDGKMIVYVEKSAAPFLQYGDEIIAQANIISIQAPKNDYVFDYKKYLERQNVYGQSFIKKDAIKVVNHHPPSKIWDIICAIRAEANEIIDEFIDSKDEKSIVKALTLGQKEELGDSIKKDYAAAGAIHILAVSGLHVGIIYQILCVVLMRLKNGSHQNKIVFSVISILLIWLYACITGLSPSIQRAATMFSFILIGEVFNKRGNIYNTLAFTAFILLLFDPLLLYAVGFQLSFLAVVGIVYFYPYLNKLWSPSLWIVNFLWKISCVSIAAQIATFPLVAFYFHSFPTFFLLTNWVIIPLSTIIMFSSLLLLLLSPIFPIVGTVMGEVLYFSAKIANVFVHWIHNIKYSTIEWIYIDATDVFIIYITIIILLLGYYHQLYRYFLASSLAICIFFGKEIANVYEDDKRKMMMFYAANNDNIGVDFIDGSTTTFYSNMLPSDNFQDFVINPNRLALHLESIEKSKINSLIHASDDADAIGFGWIGNKRLVMFNNSTFHLSFKKEIACDLIVINNESVKSLEWLQSHFQAEKIILGYGNSKYYTQEIKKKAQQMNISIRDLSKERFIYHL